MQGDVGQPDVAARIDVDAVRQVERVAAPSVLNGPGLGIQRQHRIYADGPVQGLCVLVVRVEGAAEYNREAGAGALNNAAAAMCAATQPLGSRENASVAGEALGLPRCARGVFKKSYNPPRLDRTMRRPTPATSRRPRVII